MKNEDTFLNEIAKLFVKVCEKNPDTIEIVKNSLSELSTKNKVVQSKFFNADTIQQSLSKYGVIKFNRENKNGIYITMPNNFVVSVQWSYGNYCENDRNMTAMTSPVPSEDCEIAMWRTDNDDFIDFDIIDQDVCGWVDKDKLIAFLDKVIALPDAPLPCLLDLLSNDNDDVTIEDEAYQKGVSVDEVYKGESLPKSDRSTEIINAFDTILESNQSYAKMFSEMRALIAKYKEEPNV